MKKHTIVIEIDGEGRLTADADGFEGDQCVRDIERLLADLASAPAEVKRKTEAGTCRTTGTRRTVSKGRKS